PPSQATQFNPPPSQPTQFGPPSQPTQFGPPSQPTQFGPPSQPTQFGPPPAIPGPWQQPPMPRGEAMPVSPNKPSFYREVRLTFIRPEDEPIRARVTDVLAHVGIIVSQVFRHPVHMEALQAHLAGEGRYDAL